MGNLCSSLSKKSDTSLPKTVDDCENNNSLPRSSSKTDADKMESSVSANEIVPAQVGELLIKDHKDNCCYNSGDKMDQKVSRRIIKGRRSITRIRYKKWNTALDSNTTPELKNNSPDHASRKCKGVLKEPLDMLNKKDYSKNKILQNLLFKRADSNSSVEEDKIQCEIKIPNSQTLKVCELSDTIDKSKNECNNHSIKSFNDIGSSDDIYLPNNENIKYCSDIKNQGICDLTNSSSVCDQNHDNRPETARIIIEEESKMELNENIRPNDEQLQKNVAETILESINILTVNANITEFHDQGHNSSILLCAHNENNQMKLDNNTINSEAVGAKELSRTIPVNKHEAVCDDHIVKGQCYNRINSSSSIEEDNNFQNIINSKNVGTQALLKTLPLVTIKDQCDDQLTRCPCFNRVDFSSSIEEEEEDKKENDNIKMVISSKAVESELSKNQFDNKIDSNSSNEDNKKEDLNNAINEEVIESPNSQHLHAYEVERNDHLTKNGSYILGGSEIIIKQEINNNNNNDNNDEDNKDNNNTEAAIHKVICNTLKSSEIGPRQMECNDHFIRPENCEEPESYFHTGNDHLKSETSKNNCIIDDEIYSLPPFPSLFSTQENDCNETLKICQRFNETKPDLFVASDAIKNDDTGEDCNNTIITDVCHSADSRAKKISKIDSNDQFINRESAAKQESQMIIDHNNNDARHNEIMQSCINSISKEINDASRSLTINIDTLNYIGPSTKIKDMNDDRPSLFNDNISNNGENPEYRDSISELINENNESDLENQSISDNIIIGSDQDGLPLNLLKNLEKKFALKKFTNNLRDNYQYQKSTSNTSPEADCHFKMLVGNVVDELKDKLKTINSTTSRSFSDSNDECALLMKSKPKKATFIFNCKPTPPSKEAGLTCRKPINKELKSYFEGLSQIKEKSDTIIGEMVCSKSNEETKNPKDSLAEQEKNCRENKDNLSFGLESKGQITMGSSQNFSSPKMDNKSQDVLKTNPGKDTKIPTKSTKIESDVIHTGMVNNVSVNSINSTKNVLVRDKFQDNQVKSPFNNNNKIIIILPTCDPKCDKEKQPLPIVSIKVTDVLLRKKADDNKNKLPWALDTEEQNLVKRQPYLLKRLNRPHNYLINNDHVEQISNGFTNKISNGEKTPKTIKFAETPQYFKLNLADEIPDDEKPNSKSIDQDRVNQNDKYFDQVALNICQKKIVSFETLIFQLIHENPNVKNDLDKCRAVFTWLTNKNATEAHFEYINERKDYRIAETESPDVYLHGLCTGQYTYAQFFQLLCRFAGLRCKLLRGYAKGNDFKPGMKLNGGKAAQHAWNSVEINGIWYLCDTHWTARRLAGRNSGQAKSNSTKLDLFYFLIHPEDMKYSHHPFEKDWQLSANPITLESFEKLAIVKPAFFRFELSFYNSMEAIIKTTKDIKIELQFPSNTNTEKLIFTYTLQMEGKLNDAHKDIPLSRYGIVEILKIDDKSSIVRFWIRFPESASYKIMIFAKSIEDQLFNGVCEYYVIADIGPDEEKATRPFPPTQQTCYGKTELLAKYDITSSWNNDAIITLEESVFEIKFQSKRKSESVSCPRLMGRLKCNSIEDGELSKRLLIRIMASTEENYKTTESVYIRGFLPENNEYALEVYANNPEVEGSSFFLIWQHLIVCEKGNFDMPIPHLNQGFILGAQERFKELGLRAISHPDPFILIDQQSAFPDADVCIKLGFPVVKQQTSNSDNKHGIRILGQLLDASGNCPDEENDYSNLLLQQAYINEDDSNCEVEFDIRVNKDSCFYKLYIYAMSLDKELDTVPLAMTYLIQINSGIDYNTLRGVKYGEFPQQTSQWKEDCRLIAPKNKILKLPSSDSESKHEEIFEVIIPHAMKVASVVNEEWIQFKQSETEKNRWTGSVFLTSTIKSGTLLSIFANFNSRYNSYIPLLEYVLER